MKNYVDGGEAIVEAFRKLNIDYIMSSPGSEWSPVWEALARQKLEHKAGPSFMECWHETLAVNLASGYTLITGRPQAVLLHAGVGVLQGSMGIEGALEGEIPMIVMSGESQTLGENPDLAIEPQWYERGLSVGGIERLIAPVTKWARAVTSPFTLYESVIRAGEMAQRSPMGPIYLNVALEHMLHDWTPPRGSAREVPPAPKVQAPPEQIGKVAELIHGASSPIIVAETSGRDPAAFTALVEFADALAIPVIAGRSGIYANFPTTHPLYLGVACYEHLQNADLVLLVSCQAPWYPPQRRPTSGKIVSIHDNPIKDYMIYQRLHADECVEGDVASTLRMLNAAAKANAKAVNQRREQWSGAHDKMIAELRREQEQARAGKAIDPVALFAALAEVMPQDAIYVSEVITHTPAMRRHLPIHMPQSFFRVSGGLGQGIGTALGIKLAAPSRPVVLLVGDGSFLYNPIIQALGASKHHNISVLIVVLNNKGYRAMKQGHVHHYPDGSSVNSDFYYGVNIDGPPYHEIGSHFGFSGQRVEEPAQLKAALSKALKTVSGGATVILDVVLSR